MANNFSIINVSIAASVVAITGMTAFLHWSDTEKGSIANPLTASAATNNPLPETFPLIEMASITPPETQVLPEINSLPYLIDSAKQSDTDISIEDQLNQEIHVNKAAELDASIHLSDDNQNTGYWNPSSKPEAELPKIAKEISEKTAIDFDPSTIANTQIGDRVKLNIFGNQELTAKVENKTTFNNGDVSWQGHVEGFGDQYPVTFTSGENTAFATVTTPQGSYSLETINGSGWLYKNPDESELTRRGQEDFIEIGS